MTTTGKTEIPLNYPRCGKTTEWHTFVIWEKVMPETSPPLRAFKTWINIEEGIDHDLVVVMALRQAIRNRGGLIPGEKDIIVWVMVVRPGTELWSPDRPVRSHITQFILNHEKQN